MIFIKPSFEILEQGNTEVDMAKHIEKCGRVAWKSEEKTTEDSYVKFIQMLEGVNHGSVLEHGTIFLTIPYTKGENQEDSAVKAFLIQFFKDNKYSHCYFRPDDEDEGKFKYFITTNQRVIYDGSIFTHIPYITNRTKNHENRITVRFICDRGVSHKLFVA